jgi:hypothetical protein
MVPNNPMAISLFLAIAHTMVNEYPGRKRQKSLNMDADDYQEVEVNQMPAKQWHVLRGTRRERIPIKEYYQCLAFAHLLCLG